LTSEIQLVVFWHSSTSPQTCLVVSHRILIQLCASFYLAFRKTGWANQQSAAAGIVEVKTDEIPADANEKVEKANAALIQLTGTGLITVAQQGATAQALLSSGGAAAALGILPAQQVQSVAEAALEMALGGAAPNVQPVPAVAVAPSVSTALIAPAPVVVDATVVGRSDNPSQHILVHNMFDKDEETEPNWENDIKLDFEEECAQYGKMTSVVVMSKEVGGKIYASFESSRDAMNCAKNLAGRWFDKRQLRVEFVDAVPSA
jgi:RNA-binding protein 39